MTLEQFLLTANTDDVIALQEAKALRAGRLMSPDMMLAYITKFGLVDALISNPTTNESKAVQAAFQFGSEFNLINGHPASIVEILDILITDNVVPVQFKDALIHYANELSDPLFPDISLYDIKLVRGTCPKKALLIDTDGYVTITLSQDCLMHNPRVTCSVYNQRLGENKEVRVTSFYKVSQAGKYEALIPTVWRTYDLFVDDPYNVVN